MFQRCIINARFLNRPISGVERYATELLKALDSLLDSGLVDSKQISFTLLAPQGTENTLNLKHIPFKCVGYFRSHLWEQIELPFYSHSCLLLSLCNTAPVLKCNQLVTIHDAVVFGFPQAYSWAFRTWYQLLWTSLGVVAKQVLTVSFFSRKELNLLCRISEKKLQVIYEGSEHLSLIKGDEEILQKNNLVNQRFVLAVSSLNLNKNFYSVTQAIELLGEVDFAFVVAGGTKPEVFKRSLGFTRHYIKHVGYVSDAELRALYEHASCFIYPSFYEGFGLPPLEAMACGCPVIVSHAASLPEVCADAALYCDPYSPEDIAAKITLIMSNSALQEELRLKGLERAKKFTWDKCARETFAVIEKALDSDG